MSNIRVENRGGLVTPEGELVAFLRIDLDPETVEQLTALAEAAGISFGGLLRSVGSTTDYLAVLVSMALRERFR